MFVATKIRNIRNALRNIRGFKRVRSFADNPSRNARLTLRILECNSNEQILKEIEEANRDEILQEELTALEQSLVIVT